VGLTDLGGDMLKESYGVRCPKCSQAIVDGDTVVWTGARIVHLDCRRPRALNFDEVAVLFAYCWDHAVAECVPCGRRYRQIELDSELLRCAKCGSALIDSIRAHLHDCGLLPPTIRRRVLEAYERSRILVKLAQQLSDGADVLAREVEARLHATREPHRVR